MMSCRFHCIRMPLYTPVCPQKAPPPPPPPPPMMLIRNSELLQFYPLSHTDQHYPSVQMKTNNDKTSHSIRNWAHLPDIARAVTLKKTEVVAWQQHRDSRLIYRLDIGVPIRSSAVFCQIWARFLSLVQSKLRLCSANHRPGYWSKLSCDWPSTASAYSEQETENGPSLATPPS